jgi:hypothetical protein
MSDDPTTVTEALTSLAAEGYGEDLQVVGGVLECRVCGQTHPADAAEVERVQRFEGPSDPGDEMMVLGLRCPHCGAKGSLATAFGIDADPELAQMFVYLAERARHT